MSMKQMVPILGSLLLLSSPMLAQAPAAASHPAVEVIQSTTPDASVLKARRAPILSKSITETGTTPA